jgi:Arc/MetJ-type ribon-helix-helix transcriptional regulator
MKKRFSISMDEELVDWIDEKVKNKEFSNKSHGLEFCVKTVMDIPERNFLTLQATDEFNKVIEENTIFVPDRLLDKLKVEMECKGFKTCQELFDSFNQLPKETFDKAKKALDDKSLS